MFDVIKSAMRYYQEEKHRENMKKRLLRSHLDYDYLEYMIDEAGNKKVEIEIELNDHTIIKIKPTKSRNNNTIFTGD